MTKEVIVAQNLAPPVEPFAHAVRDGGFLFLSGRIGQDPRTGRVVEGGVERQTEQVLENVRTVLAAAGKRLEDVGRVAVYLTSMSDLVAMNVVYARYFGEPYPVRTTVAVAGLPLNAAVEMDVMARG